MVYKYGLDATERRLRIGDIIEMYIRASSAVDFATIPLSSISRVFAVLFCLRLNAMARRAPSPWRGVRPGAVRALVRCASWCGAHPAAVRALALRLPSHPDAVRALSRRAPCRGVRPLAACSHYATSRVAAVQSTHLRLAVTHPQHTPSPPTGGCDG